jgi:hypothetical protein
MKMKTTVAFAAIIAVAASAPAFASSPEQGGHYEWRYAPKPGPNKSNLPNYRRVWIADSGPSMAMKEGCNTMPCCATATAQT